MSATGHKTSRDSSRIAPIKRVVRDVSALAESANTANSATQSWPPPIPLYEFDPPAFPVQVLPGWLKDFVEAEAVATQTPIDLGGMMSLAVLAMTSARYVEVEVKPGWREPLNIYVVVAMPSGSRKSAVFRDLISPVEAEEERLALEMGNRTGVAMEEKRSLQQKLRKARRDYDGGKGDFGQVQDAASLLNSFDVPVLPRLLADDITSEGLEILLEQQGGRMALIAAEGDIFDILMGRYSTSGITNLGVFLKAHAGDPIRVDRTTRESVSVQRPALTLGLAVQPAVIEGLAARKEFRGRGLIARFLYSLPESNVGRREVDTPPVPKAIRSTYDATITRLLETRAKGEGDDNRPQILHLTDHGRETLLGFAKRIEPELAATGDLGAYADWGGKLVGVVARVAGNLHMAIHVNDNRSLSIPVEEEVIERAIEVAEYLIPHSLAAHALMGADPTVGDANHILNWIIGKRKVEFSKRDLFEGVKGRFKKVNNLKSGLALLEDHEYIRERLSPSRPNRSGRPPSPVYDVNPASHSQKSHYSQYPSLGN